MPILNIEIIGPIAPEQQADLASRLADLAGKALNSHPHGTWVKLHFIPSEHYAENTGGPAIGVLPVIVTLLQAQVPEEKALATQVKLLAAAISKGIGRPIENVHIIVEPAASGRIAFGGSMLEDH